MYDFIGGEIYKNIKQKLNKIKQEFNKNWAIFLHFFK